MDIVSERGDVLLDVDWLPCESMGGRPSRRLTSDATAHLLVEEQIEHRVSVDVEAVDVPNGEPVLVLVIFDDRGRVIANAPVAERRTIDFTLPGGRPKQHRLRFHVEDGSGSAAGLRVLDIHVQPLRPEVVDLSAGFRIGRGGWYILEEASGEVFRWVRNDAEIVVTNAAATILELDVEPGPGVRGRPFVLTVLDRHGDAITRARIDARRRLPVAVPSTEETPFTITLHADRGGAQIPGDPRILNFRVFHIPPV